MKNKIDIMQENYEQILENVELLKEFLKKNKSPEVEDFLKKIAKKIRQLSFY